MGLREISDFINKERNAKFIGATSLMVIIGSCFSLGKHYPAILKEMDSINCKRNEAIYSGMFNAQENIIHNYKMNECTYKKMIIEQFQREMIYEDIIKSLLNQNSKNYEKEHRDNQITPQKITYPETI